MHRVGVPHFHQSTAEFLEAKRDERNVKRVLLNPEQGWALSVRGPGWQKRSLTLRGQDVRGGQGLGLVQQGLSCRCPWKGQVSTGLQIGAPLSQHTNPLCGFLSIKILAPTSLIQSKRTQSSLWGHPFQRRNLLR